MAGAAGARLALMEESISFQRLLELAQRTDRIGRCGFTPFLTPPEAELAQAAARRCGVEAELFGGYGHGSIGKAVLGFVYGVGFFFFFGGGAGLTASFGVSAGGVSKGICGRGGGKGLNSAISGIGSGSGPRSASVRNKAAA